MFFMADKESRRSDDKTIAGNLVRLVAIQSKRRRNKKRRKCYIYHISNTNIVVYNRSRNGIFFMRMAMRPTNIARYYDVFVRPPLTDAEKQWLKLYDYEIV